MLYLKIFLYGSCILSYLFFFFYDPLTPLFARDERTLRPSVKVLFTCSLGWVNRSSVCSLAAVIETHPCVCVSEFRAEVSRSGGFLQATIITGPPVDEEATRDGRSLTRWSAKKTSRTTPFATSKDVEDRFPWLVGWASGRHYAMKSCATPTHRVTVGWQPPFMHLTGIELGSNCIRWLMFVGRRGGCL